MMRNTSARAREASRLWHRANLVLVLNLVLVCVEYSSSTITHRSAHYTVTIAASHGLLGRAARDSGKAAVSRILAPGESTRAHRGRHCSARGRRRRRVRVWLGVGESQQRVPASQASQASPLRMVGAIGYQRYQVGPSICASSFTDERSHLEDGKKKNSKGGKKKENSQLPEAGKKKDSKGGKKKENSQLPASL